MEILAIPEYPFYFILISSETEVQVKASVFIRIALYSFFLSVSLLTHFKSKQGNVLVLKHFKYYYFYLKHKIKPLEKNAILIFLASLQEVV